jgi:hypothetical protein
MTLQAFAEDHRLTVRRDEANDRIIPGKHGHIWERGERFAVTLLDLTPRKWNHRKRLCLEEGMELDQDGDFEGTLLFDPTNADQAEAAIGVAKIRKRKVPSEAQLRSLTEGRKPFPRLDRSRSGGLEGAKEPWRYQGRVEGSKPFFSKVGRVAGALSKTQKLSRNRCDSRTRRRKAGAAG